MKKMKVLLCLGMTIILLGGYMGQLVAASSPAATDRWAVEYVERATSLGLVPPTFTNLSLPITRAEFADLAVRLYENMIGSEITGRVSFSDTSDINVQKMGYLGIVLGVGDGYFNPYGEITREQAAVLLVRLFNAIYSYLDIHLPAMFDMPHLPSTFTDYEQISHWAFNGVAAAYAMGLMRGVGNNIFLPSGDYTKQQSIVTILRLFDIFTAGELANGAPDENMTSAPAGIVMNILSYTASGLSFHFENLTDLELIYGAGFELYTFVNGAWEPVAPITDELWAFPGVAHFVAPNSSTEERTVNWTAMFGELPSGQYRFQKEILFVRQPGDFDRFVLESDFTLLCSDILD